MKTKEQNRAKRSCCSPFHSFKSVVLSKDNQVLSIMAIVNVVNFALVAVKLVVAYSTGSFSIANSTLESFGDVFAGFLILFQRLQTRFVEESRFPRGRNTAALSNVVAGVVMLLLACVNAVLNFDRYIRHKFDPQLDMSDIAVIGGNIFLKAFLLIVCWSRREVDQINVLFKDQFVDILTNSTAVFFAFLTKYSHKNWDILGATIIFLVICGNWIPILFSNCNRIHGVAASSEKETEIREFVTKFDEVESIKDLITYHRGEGLVVEIYAHIPSNQNDVVEKLTKTLLTLDYVDIVHVFSMLFTEARSCDLEDVENGRISTSREKIHHDSKQSIELAVLLEE